VTDRATDDEARWAEAVSVLDRMPTESADRRLRRVRRNRLLAIAAFTLLVLVAAMVVALLVRDLGGEEADQDVPTWRAVVGFSLSGLGLVVMVVGLVLVFRRFRGSRGWRSPLNVLTFRQRRELVHQIRGSAPLVPERVPLIRHQADLLIAHRVTLLPQTGILLNLAGLWVADRSVFRLVVVGLLAVVLLAAAVLGQRDVVHARRFLAAHPAVDEGRPA
jgi:hypothetical protein